MRGLGWWSLVGKGDDKEAKRRALIFERHINVAPVMDTRSGLSASKTISKETKPLYVPDTIERIYRECYLARDTEKDKVP